VIKRMWCERRVLASSAGVEVESVLRGVKSNDKVYKGVYFAESLNNI